VGLCPPRGSAFGLLATVQSIGNLIASSVAGILWTTVSPEVAFIFLAAAMVIAAPLILITLRKSARPPGGGCLSATRRFTIHSAMTPMALDAALLKGPLLDVLRA
jgi:hypothetical protein